VKHPTAYESELAAGLAPGGFARSSRVVRAACREPAVRRPNRFNIHQENTMRSLQTLFAVAAVAGLSVLAGCTSDGSDHHYRSSRSYDPYYGTSRTASRSYDPYYDSASTASSSYDHRPWRDSAGNLHHDADWKADSDRGRLSNDRDDKYDRTYNDRYYNRY
jgi:hypothetical protein